MPTPSVHITDIRSSDSDRPRSSIKTPHGWREEAVLHSILFCDPRAYLEFDSLEPPECFRDLQLDQVVDAVVAGREEYTLRPYFYLPLKTVPEITYRQDVLRELETGPTGQLVRTFAASMRTVRKQLQFAEECFHKAEKHRWFLDAIALYCDVVRSFVAGLPCLSLQSAGMRDIAGIITAYVESNDFKSLQAEVQELQSILQTIRYSLHISGNRIAVTRHHNDSDYGAQVATEFQAFNQNSDGQMRFGTKSDAHLNHIEHAILDMLTDLYPKVFSSIESFHERYIHSAIHPNILLFETEAQFVLAYLDYMKEIRGTGLSFCYPVVSDHGKDISGADVFDLALAPILLRRKSAIVTNSFNLNDAERVIVISGPNQGGKTTFARTIGQLHYLARIGCTVAGRQAKLLLCDEIFTVFEREEDLRTHSGKLEEELLRIHEVLATATSRSLLIMNESFASTAPSDALLLGRKIMEKIMTLDMLCVLVTFIDELASFSQATVSMVAAVNPADISQRTFQLIRRPADGRAYAMAIADKYRLTRELVRERIAANSVGN